MAKRKKRDKLERAFALGFKAGIHGHDIETCPFSDLVEERGHWFGGWREGRSNYISGYLNMPNHSSQERTL